MRWRVFVYVPNIIGYIRLLLLVIGWWHFNYPIIFIPCYLSSVILDGVDGFSARRLNQTSEFGAWFDVLIDNIGRSMMWNSLYDWGHFMSSLEWCVFVCTHSSLGSDWKKKFEKSPWLIQKIMSNDFRSVLGTWAISGIHILPIWLYGYQKLILTKSLVLPVTAASIYGEWFVTGLLISGRILCMGAELWCIWIHIVFLVQNEDKGK